MPHRTTSIAAQIAHLVGPGKLKVINGRLAFTTGKGTPTRLDPDTLRHVLCYGHVGISDQAMTMLLRHDIQVAWLTAGGRRCHGRLVRSDPASTLLRIQQHQVLAAVSLRLELARQVVQHKIKSQIAVVRHYQRHGKTVHVGGLTTGQLTSALDNASAARDLDVLRGVEGAAAAAWFALFGKFIKPPWQFTRRVRRPPTDPVNALLSLGYTFLTARIVARCEAVGLEVGLGALHSYRAGRPALACDLIEPLRVPLVDRWVLALCNQQHLQPDNFTTDDTGVKLHPDVFPQVLAWWEEHWAAIDGDRHVDGVVHQFVRSIRMFARTHAHPGNDVDSGVGKTVNGYEGDV